MGGKHKQANRTKNNARPSSSSHSAELLGNTIPTFCGFSTVKSPLSSLYSLPAEEISVSIDSDYQIWFKQMSKKDPTTRFKALQLFTDAVINSDPGTVKGILPLWPRMYCSLCTDVDHKVREFSHKAHRAVISKVKKMIAPYLKGLAGPWFISQYDTYPPAASAATLAFEEAFPSTKFNKVIVFCQEEILCYIYDNLILQSQSPSSSSVISAEDMQARYERIILASLQGYSLFLQKLSSDQIQETEESNKKLISNSKFWKYAKHKIPTIRSAFFHCLISLCQRAKFLLSGESSRLSNVIFNNLDETDPVVLHSVWDAALNVLVSIEDCWLHINIEKQLFTKLCGVLKGGGRNVSTIYPNILPLISKLPPDILKGKQTFFIMLFDSMRCGLEAISFSQSTFEGKIMATSFIECLKYAIIQNITDEDFCTSLLTHQLVPALEDKLSTSKNNRPVIKPFLIQTAYLIRYWDSNRQTHSLVYEKLVNDFFVSLFTLYSKQLNSDAMHSSVNDLMNLQIHFLKILLNPDGFVSKNKGKVKFEEEENIEKDNICKVDIIKDMNFVKEIIPFVKKLVRLYFENAIANENKSYIFAIREIVILFEAKMVFEELVIAVNESTYFKLFSSYFSKWLMKENMKCGELVDLSFKLLKLVTDDEKEYILEEFCSNWLSDSLQLNIWQALPNYSEDPCILKWVKSDQFASNIVNLVDKFIEGSGSEEISVDIFTSLLKSKFQNGEYIVGSFVVGRIMELLSEKLEEPQKFRKFNLIQLSQSLIFNAGKEQLNQSSLSALVASLFKISCYSCDDEKLLKAIQTGLTIIICSDMQTELDFTIRLCKAIKEIIMDSKVEYNLELLVSNINFYFELMFNTNLEDTCSEKFLNAEKVKKVIKFFFETDTETRKCLKVSEKTLEKFCKVAFEANESLEFEYMEQERYFDFNLETPICTKNWKKCFSFDVKEIQMYVKWNLYIGNILNLIYNFCCKNTSQPKNFNDYKYLHKNAIEFIQSKANEFKITTKNKDEALNVTNDADDKKFYDAISIKDLLEEIKDFLICVALLETFIKYYAGTSYFKELIGYSVKIKNTAISLMKNLKLPDFQFLYNHFRIFVKKQSIWWILKSKIIEIFNETFVEEDNGNKESSIEKRFIELENFSISSFTLNQGNFFKILFFVDLGYVHRFKEKQWDSIFIFIHNSFEGFLTQSEYSESDLFVLSSLSCLYLRLRKIFREIKCDLKDPKIPEETCIAWNEVVVTEVYEKFFKVWRNLAKLCYNEKFIIPHWIIVLQSVGDVIIDGLTDRRCKENKEIIELVLESAELMTSPHAVIQITSFQICLWTIPYMVELDSELYRKSMIKMYEDGKESSNVVKNVTNDNWTIKLLQKELSHNQGIVDILLSDFIIGDCCTVEPYTDSFTYTYSYLLLWCFLLNTCGRAQSSLRTLYGKWLQETRHISTFLGSVFKLMPQKVLHGIEVKGDFLQFFERDLSLDFREPVQCELVEKIACYSYRVFLERLPNFAREWWSHTEHKTSSLVEKVTRLYVSPILISKELKNVKERNEGFEIQIYPGSREVVGTYCIDEVKMNLVLTLPLNYPLDPPIIDSSNVVVGNHNWRNLLFYICKHVIHQNGRIWDALAIWKDNLDKKFEGVEECYICFSILQGSSFEIPRLSCHTCKKKFHSNCLYKWFSTSNNSTCPVCRNLF